MPRNQSSNDPYARFQARQVIAHLEQERRRINEPLNLTNELANLTPQQRKQREEELRRTLPQW